MSWFDRLAPFRKGGSAVAEAIREEAGNGSAKTSPPLMCLVNDASGRASFKTHSFADSESATDFVLYWFPNQSEGGIIAFWALTYEPSLDSSAETTAEPLVMVRDLRRDGVVYLFSFSDIDSAQAFLRDEVQHGTDLGAMMLYWAVPVRMAADPWGKMMLTPSLPPGAVEKVEPEASAGDMWTPSPTTLAPEIPDQEPVEDTRAIFEEAPNAYTGVAEAVSAADETFQLTAWMERARKKPSLDSEPSTPRIARSSWIPAEEPVARAEARIEPPLMEEDIIWPTSPSRIEEPPFTPAPIVDEAPAETVEFYAATEPAHIVEDTPPAADASDSTQAPAPAEPVYDSLVPAVESAVEPEVALEDFPVEPVAFEAIVDEPTSLTSAAEEVLQTLERPAAEPEEAPVEDGELQIDLPTIRVHHNGNGHLSDADKPGNGYITLEPAEIVVHQNGHSASAPAEIEPEPASEPATEAEAKATVTQDENGNVDYGVDIRIDIRLDTSRAMKVKRWETKEEPFEGFNSPPGRF